MIKWCKSQDGYVKSKCGIFEIQPLYMGCDKPQAYKLYKNGKEVKTWGRFNTQKEAKEKANEI